jgi:hypothetical protein
VFGEQDALDAKDEGDVVAVLANVRVCCVSEDVGRPHSVQTSITYSSYSYIHDMRYIPKLEKKNHLYLGSAYRYQ